MWARRARGQLSRARRFGCSYAKIQVLCELEPKRLRGEQDLVWCRRFSINERVRIQARVGGSRPLTSQNHPETIDSFFVGYNVYLDYLEYWKSRETNVKSIPDPLV